MTNLIMMVGLSGSGKSVEAAKIKKNYENHAMKTMIVSSDNLRETLYGDVNDQTHNEEVFKAMRQIINNNIDKINIIVDATNLQVKHRKAILDLVRDKMYVNKVAVVMAVPISVCIVQNEKRSRKVPIEVINRQESNFQIPFYEEGFNKIILVNVDCGIANETYGKNLSNIDPNDNYILGRMKNYDQENPHHIYTLDVHCQKCAEALSNLTTNKVLIRAGVIHDYGKLFTKNYNMETGIATYYNHQNVGTYKLMTEEIDSIGFSDYNSILKCLFYVNYHMLPFFAESDRSKEKWKKIMGEDNFKDLTLFNVCDKIASGTSEERSN